MVSLASIGRAPPRVIAPGVGSSLKRKHADTDLHSDDVPPNQLKRARVTFNPAVNIHILPDPNERSLELVSEEVRRALERHAVDDNAAYDEIRHLITANPTSVDAPHTALLQKYIFALTNHVPTLDRTCAPLVHAIIKMDWIARHDQFVRSYRHFLRSLLSVQPGYTSAVLNMLIAMFVEMPPPVVRQLDDPPIQRSKLYSRVHDFIKHLLRYDPMATTNLPSILAQSFPFETDTTKVHTRYIRNILAIAEYCPGLKGEITAMIMDRLVKIDVQIQVDMDDLDEDVEEHILEEGKDAEEGDENDISDNESVSSEESLSEEEQRLKELQTSIAKLDAIMDILFTHYSAIFAGDNLCEKDEAFESLLSQFANIILPTYRSRHTQFLLFHFSQTSPDLVERFAGCCSHLAFDQRQPHLVRVAAAAYLASFIARGAHVSSAVVRDVFELLCHHLETLRATQEPACKGPDLSRYGTYYAVCQALLYCFCFRWRDLIVAKDGMPPSDEDIVYHEGDFVWSGDIQNILRRNILSKLNPLKICSPSIVTQFARVAHHLRFLYIFPIIETNKRVRLARSLTGAYEGIAVRETALTMKKGEGSFQLDAYFPFDPYVLPRSKRWLGGDYVEWKPIPGMEPLDDDEDGDDEEEEESDSEESDSEMDDDDGDEHDEVMDDGTGTEASV